MAFPPLKKITLLGYMIYIRQVNIVMVLRFGGKERKHFIALYGQQGLFVMVNSGQASKEWGELYKNYRVSGLVQERKWKVYDNVKKSPKPALKKRVCYCFSLHYQ